MESTRTQIVNRVAPDPKDILSRLVKELEEGRAADVVDHLLTGDSRLAEILYEAHIALKPKHAALKDDPLDSEDR